MNTPEGWQLAPKEPTPEMSLAAESYASHHNRVPFGAGYYRAMLSAAPQPPEQPALSICKSEVKRVATLMGWTPPIGEPAPQGGLTSDRLHIASWNVLESGKDRWPDIWNVKLSQVRAFTEELARAIEREVLATHKRSEDEVARIMGAVDAFGDERWSDRDLTPGGRSEFKRAEVERLIRGDSA